MRKQRILNHLRFAEEIVLFASRPEELQQLIHELKIAGMIILKSMMSLYLDITIPVLAKNRSKRRFQAARRSVETSMLRINKNDHKRIVWIAQKAHEMLSK